MKTIEQLLSEGGDLVSQLDWLTSKIDALREEGTSRAHREAAHYAQQGEWVKLQLAGITRELVSARKAEEENLAALQLGVFLERELFPLQEAPTQWRA